MRSARLKVVTPLGTFYSKSNDVPDEFTGENEENFYQEICENGSFFQFNLENSKSTVYLPKQMIQQSIFIVEIRDKGEDEV